MKILRTIAISDSILTSNVLESDFTAYNAATAYALNATCFDPATHDVFRSLIAANTGNNPTLEVQWDETNPPVKWLLIGKTNKYKMFDDLNLSQTTCADNINITLATVGRNQAISLSSLDAKTVIITATSAALGVVYNQTFDLLSSSKVGSWWDYSFSESVYASTLNIFDLPNYANLSINIQIINTGGMAKCGTCIVSPIFDIGSAPNYGLTIGLVDYTTIVKYFDGRNSITRRTSAKEMDLSVRIAKAEGLATMDTLQTLLGLPVVCVGADSHAETTVYGIIRDVRYLIDYPTEQLLTLKMDGFI